MLGFKENQRTLHDDVCADIAEEIYFYIVQETQHTRHLMDCLLNGRLRIVYEMSAVYEIDY